MILNILLFSFFARLVSLTGVTQMMTPRAGRPPSDDTAAPALHTKLKKNSLKGCFLSFESYILTYFANLNIKNT